MNHLQVQSVVGTLGRVLLSALFLVSGVQKLTPVGWAGARDGMVAHGMPAVSLFLAAAVAVELLGGLALLVNLAPRVVGVVLALYLVPVTLVFHAFWAVPAAEASLQAGNFLKNLAIMGGLLHLAASSAPVVLPKAVPFPARGREEGAPA